MSLSRATVVHAFRLLLGREPQDEQAIRLHMALPNEKALGEVLLGSEEFAMLNRFSQLLELKRTKPNAVPPSTPRGRSTTTLPMVLLGNCQSRGLARLLRALTGNPQVAWHELLPEVQARLDAGELDDELRGAGLIFFHDWAVRDAVQARLPEVVARCRMVPGIAFPAFHPDADYVMDAAGTPIMGRMGQYQSSIAFFGWSQGLSVDETLGLYNAQVYRQLGFYDYWKPSRDHLLRVGELCDLPLGELVERWTRHGVWMYSMNHPRLFVLADLARALMAREGIATLPDAELFVADDLAVGPVWPLYPELAQALQVSSGSYEFKLPGQHDVPSQPVLFIGLRDLVEASFEAFAKHPTGSLHSTRMKSDRYKALAASRLQWAAAAPAGAAASATAERAAVNNPYHGLADHQFWRRAVERPALADVDPVVHSPIMIAPSDRVATAGSCFAQHISRTLSSSGFNYFVAEAAEGLAAEEATARNFGVFSCRYGNVYTARQLLQLFERAHGRLTPRDQVWQRADGRFVDPFRPQIEPEGHASADEVLAAQAVHLSAVRRMFAELDVFVFTLGLTEAWRSVEDGMVYPLAPGVAGGSYDPQRHEFVNFKAAEVVADMLRLIDELRQVNPRARVLLTVSPVPLMATYEPRHVLTSTTYSKAVLRVAAQEIVDQRADCAYFPSFEVITGNFNRGAYFESDLRSVTPEGVAHVMRLFMQHCSSAATPDQADMAAEIAAMSEVICEESALDPACKG